MLRSLACLLALAGTAAAYPVVVPKQSAAVRADREREFRKRNPTAIKTVEAGARGFIKHVVIDDPALVPALTFGNSGWVWADADVAKVRAFLRANADLFGFTPATADRLSWNGNPSLLLDDVIGGATLGEIHVAVTGKTLDITVMFWVDVTPKLTEDDIKKRVVGASYAETIGYAEPSRIDCSMTPAGPAGCKMAVKHRLNRVMTVADPEVRAVTWLFPDGDKIRLVACADADLIHDPPADPTWGDLAPSERTLSPRGKAPKLPLVVDLVTGQTIDVHVDTCYAPVFSQLRDAE